MPITVFCTSSNKSEMKGDTTQFVQKPNLRINYIESKKEEDFDMKNHNRIKNLKEAISIQDACNKNYVDNKFNDPSITKNTTNINLNDKNFSNARFIQVNQLAQIDSYPTAKLYVDNAIDESSLVRTIQDSFNNHNLSNINSIFLYNQAANDN